MFRTKLKLALIDKLKLKARETRSVVFCYFKILVEHEREELQSTSGENNEELF